MKNETTLHKIMLLDRVFTAESKFFLVHVYWFSNKTIDSSNNVDVKFYRIG